MAAPGALGIIAGGGRLPVVLAEHARSAGLNYAVIRLAGMADPDLALHPGVEIPMAALGAMIKAARDAGCDRLVLAGIVARPDFAKLRPDWRGMQALPRVLKAAQGGDDALLRAVAAELEREGFSIIGAESVLAELRAPAGPLGGHEPTPENMTDIEKARRVVAALGALDVGQGTVVCGGLVLAVEAQEGTDQMLARVAALPAEIRGTAAARRGVLLKAPKPIQERRVDLPTIGLRTIEEAVRAGLAGVAMEAGGCLVLERERAVAAADAAGMFLYGFDPTEPVSG
jgi:DUF1009 family protein